jgi:hypothetical protein
MIRYSAFDHGGAHLVRIYASWDGEDEELISERFAASYGEQESIAVVVPTRDADEVKVRAELIGNRNDFVGGGTCVIAEGEAAEQTREEKMPRLKEGIKKIQGFAADYVSEKAPLSLAENIVEKFAEKEATILDIMDFESVTRGLAEERYDERREHAISAIQLIIQPYFDKLAKEIKGSPQPWYVMKAGEHDPRATLPSDLDVSIRESIEKYEEEPPLRLSNFIDAEFKDIGAILDDEDAKAVRDWMTTGRTLDQAGIKQALLGTEFLERMRLQLPLIRKDSITGHLYIGIDNFSLGNAKSDLRIGTEVIIQKWQIKGHTIDFNFKIENGMLGKDQAIEPEASLLLQLKN